MAGSRTSLPYKDLSGTPRPIDAVDFSSDGLGVQPIHQAADTLGAPLTPAKDSTLAAVLAILSGVIATAVFAPIRGATVALTVGPAATSSPVALSPNIATTYRVRNASSSASSVTWTLSTSSTTVPVIPTPNGVNGTGGTPGDKTIDPGGVELIGLTTAQQNALANGTLYLSAICPAGGSAVLTVTPGTGA